MCARARARAVCVCLAQLGTEERQYSIGIGTPAFTAPEALDQSLSTTLYDERADVWSLGCVLVCIDGDTALPYDMRETNGESLILMVVAGRMRPEVPVVSPLYSLVRDCCLEPARRASAAQIAQRTVEPEMALRCEAADAEDGQSRAATFSSI